MPEREHWTDVALDREFQSIRDQLEALRALPAQMAAFDIRLANQNEHLLSVARDVRQCRDRTEAQTIELTRVATTIKVWVAVAAVLVSAVVAFVPHS